MIPTMLKHLRTIPQSLQSMADSFDDAALAAVTGDMSETAIQLRACANQVTGAFGAVAFDVGSAARAHEAAADALRELVLVASAAIGLIVVAWGAREIRRALT